MYTYIFFFFTYLHKIVVSAMAHNMDCVGHRLIYLHYLDLKLEVDYFCPK